MTPEYDRLQHLIAELTQRVELLEGKKPVQPAPDPFVPATPTPEPSKPATGLQIDSRGIPEQSPETIPALDLANFNFVGRS